MDKTEFQNKIKEKVNSATVLPAEYSEDIEQIKARIIPIVQEDFINSIPSQIKKGEKIKLRSRLFCGEWNNESALYIKWNGSKIRIKINYDTGDVVKDSIKTFIQLNDELKRELSELVGKEVENIYYCLDMQMLFECYY